MNLAIRNRKNKKTGKTVESNIIEFSQLNPYFTKDTRNVGTLTLLVCPKVAAFNRRVW